MLFKDKLNTAIKKYNTLLCVGLDSDIEKIPAHLRHSEHPQFTFNENIIDATYDLVCTYKINTAFYEANGTDGIRNLRMTCDYLKASHPEVPVIIDAKRGDIGNSSRAYAQFVFDFLKADAVTVSPYLGADALEPFLTYKEKGIIVLCKTSNKGGGEFQNLDIEGKPLYLAVAERIANNWNKYDNCMLVVGATHPQELKRVREAVGNMTILVPGIGAQGGDLEGVLKAGLDSSGKGLIINVSRSVIFAGNNEDYTKLARKEAEKIVKEIDMSRARP